MPDFRIHPAVDPGEGRINSSAARVGTIGLFAAAGFTLAEETEARSDRRPRWLMRLDLRAGS